MILIWMLFIIIGILSEINGIINVTYKLTTTYKNINIIFYIGWILLVWSIYSMKYI